MKQIIAGMFLVLFVFAGCGDITVYPKETLELAVGGSDCVDITVASPYTGCFSFEDNTVRNFTSDKFDPTPFDISFDTLANSTDRAYKGTHSLKLKCTYVGVVGTNTASGIVKQGTSSAALNVNFEGKKITAYVWIPGNMFASTPDQSYGGSFFYKTTAADGWRWYQSEWQNLPAGPIGSAGVWAKLTAKTNQMKTPAIAGHATGEYPPAAYQIQAWGIKVAKGTGTADYSTVVSDPDTFVYLDAVTVEPE